MKIHCPTLVKYSYCMICYGIGFRITHLKKKGCSGSADIDDDWCNTRRILVLFQWMASISFASESLMDPRIQVKLDKYQKCGNIISQTSLLSSYTGSETDADSDSR